MSKSHQFPPLLPLFLEIRVMKNLRLQEPFKQEEDSHVVHCSRERSRADWKVIQEYLIPFVERERHTISKFLEEKYLDEHFDNRHFDLLNASHGRCLADLYDALHCDLVMDSSPCKTKCNPSAATRNKHLFESLADSCFPVSNGPVSGRLHEFFLRQFCDAHTCSGGLKPFAEGQKKRRSILYIILSISTLMLLQLFYFFIYMYQRVETHKEMWHINGHG
ncbi:hypothetical protein GQ457_02G020810 [Hibiscus cannabinus]